GAWDDWHACWFNGLYLRIVPAHAVELTSAYLDRAVRAVLLHQHVHSASLARQQQLAAVIHLCGAGTADQFVRRGFRFTEEQYCGDQLAAVYVARVEGMRALFTRLAAQDPED
ncbi:MAG TPA: hypothetical protein VHZ99_03190, partial [Steroidobacteraceae bacterium]|nr:hypothetical protein [Steroidobacteraceae bacterium]